MASPAAAWNYRVVPSWASNAEPVKVLSAARLAHPSVELADYRTEYWLLGPLEVVHRGEAVPTGGQRKRALLARLLLEANRTVSIDALVDALWGERVPSTAVKMVHIYVSQLRKVLPSGALQTRPPGYRLEVAPEAVDLLRFERLRKQGRKALADGDAVTAAERLTAACALWRGPALGEFSEPFAAAAAGHLDELRLLAVEDRVDAELALGRHRDVAGELQALVASHPLRERPRRQLMLALYRQGRHAEALEAFQELRAALRDELGIDPSAGLAELQYRILNQDPALDHASPAPAPAASHPEPGSVPAPPAGDGFVGRAAELARLEQALDGATAGHGATALIGGPAGIGKTRLTGELAERARRRGAIVLTGRCIDLVGAALPYFPLVEALRPLRGTPVLDGLQELSRLLPGSPLAPTSLRNGGESQLHLFEAVRTALERLSATAPVVLVLEDLHWADGSTLDLLAFLAHAVHYGRVLIVATWRHDAVRKDDAVHRLASGLRRRRVAFTVELGPLTRDELAALVARQSDGPLCPELVESVCARAEGNPFFAEELIAAALRDEPELPELLQDALLADFQRLHAPTRAVVRFAAAAGRAVPPAVLTAAMPLGEADIVEALREAVDHGLLVADRATGSYRFRHALIAEAAYATLLPGEREDVHERLARALASDGARAGELAEHWIAARRPEEALSASLEAAREAEAVSGLSEALRHLERVLDLWDHVPRAEEVAGVAISTLLAWAGELAGKGGTEPSRPGRLAVSEARELYPLVVVLETIAIRRSPAFEPAALAALREANRRMRAAVGDPSAAMLADDAFHARLTAGCPSEPLLAVLRPVRSALLRYEQVYMLEPSRIERSAVQHDEIVRELERGNHAGAAQRLRRNLTGGLPDLTDALEAG
jgi:DNA-binding SARP family transcriptional activator